MQISRRGSHGAVRIGEAFGDTIFMVSRCSTLSLQKHVLVFSFPPPPNFSHWRGRSERGRERISHSISRGWREQDLNWWFKNKNYSMAATDRRTFLTAGSWTLFQQPMFPDCTRKKIYYFLLFKLSGQIGKKKDYHTLYWWRPWGKQILLVS